MIKINLLREAPGHKRAVFTTSFSPATMVAVAAAAVIALGLVWWYYSLAQDLTASRDQATQLEQESQQLKQVQARVLQLEQTKSNLERRIQLIDTLLRNQKGPVTLMNGVLASIPADPKLWLTSMNQRDRTVIIEGQAFDVPAIADYIATLGKTPPFQNVELEFWQQQDDVYKFRLSCQTGNL